MHVEDIEYHADGARLIGRLFVDDARAGPRPGVLVAPEGLGLSEHTFDIATRLAEISNAALPSRSAKGRPPGCGRPGRACGPYPVR